MLKPNNTTGKQGLTTVHAASQTLGGSSGRSASRWPGAALALGDLDLVAGLADIGGLDLDLVVIRLGLELVAADVIAGSAVGSSWSRLRRPTMR